MNIAVLGSIAGLMVTTGGAYVAVDSRYARAADVAALTRSIGNAMEINRLSAEANTLELRRAAVLDKLQDAAARKSMTPAEQAIAQRYQSDLKFVESQLRDKQRQIDALRKPN